MTSSTDGEPGFFFRLYESYFRYRVLGRLGRLRAIYRAFYYELRKKEPWVTGVEIRELLTQVGDLLTDPDDQRSAVMVLSAPADEPEAVRGLHLLFNVYGEWAFAQGCAVDLYANMENAPQGTVAWAITVHGPWSYGLLSVERGTHRLVTNPQGTGMVGRVTSFVTVDVFPYVDKQVTDDLRVRPQQTGTTVRSSVFTPYQYTVDPRTNHSEDATVDKMDLGAFIMAGVRWRHEQGD